MERSCGVNSYLNMRSVTHKRSRNNMKFLFTFNEISLVLKQENASKFEGVLLKILIINNNKQGTQCFTSA